MKDIYVWNVALLTYLYVLMFTELIQGAKQKLVNVSDDRLKDNDTDVEWKHTITLNTDV